MVVIRVDEDLRLMLQATERLGMEDAGRGRARTESETGRGASGMGPTVRPFRARGRGGEAVTFETFEVGPFAAVEVSHRFLARRSRSVAGSSGRR